MTADTQLELPVPAAAATASTDEVAELMWLLSGQDWQTAKQLMLRRAGWHDRHIRAIAAASEGQVLSGQKGYKLTLACTPEEVHHATAWLRSQAAQMTQRSLDIARIFHRAVHMGGEQP